MERAQGDDALVRSIMRRQARLGLRIAVVFVLILVGLPLLNLYAPEAMAARVGGFSLTWLLLALLFYPVTWILSWIFVSGSDREEDAIVAAFREGRLAGAPAVAQAYAGATPSPTVPSFAPQGESSPKPKKRKLFVEDDAE